MKLRSNCAGSTSPFAPIMISSSVASATVITPVLETSNAALASSPVASAKVTSFPLLAEATMVPLTGSPSVAGMSAKKSCPVPRVITTPEPPSVPSAPAVPGAPGAPFADVMVDGGVVFVRFELTVTVRVDAGEDADTAVFAFGWRGVSGEFVEGNCSGLRTRDLNPLSWAKMNRCHCCYSYCSQPAQGKQKREPRLGKVEWRIFRSSFCTSFRWSYTASDRQKSGFGMPFRQPKQLSIVNHAYTSSSRKCRLKDVAQDNIAQGAL